MNHDLLLSTLFPWIADLWTQTLQAYCIGYEIRNQNPDIRIGDCGYCIPEFPPEAFIYAPAALVIVFAFAVLLRDNIECAIDSSANQRVDLSKEDNPTIAGCPRFNNRTIGYSKNPTISDN